MADETIVLEVDDSRVQSGTQRANQAMQGYERQASQSAANASSAFAGSGEVLIRITERSRQAQERLIQTYERQAQLYGKSGIDRLIAERDILIRKLGNEEEAVKRVNAAYEKMAAVERDKQPNVFSGAERLLGTIVTLEAMKSVIKEVAVESALLAAKADTYRVALDAAGKSNNVSVIGLHQQEERLKSLGIATIEARQSLLRMVTAQIDVNKATELGRLAQNVAVIGLTNSSEAFEKLIYGIQSGQTRVLRTLGINVSFEESYEKLAKTLGKTTLELDDYEKVQARTNAVLAVAPRFAGLYEESMGSVGKQMTSLKRYFDEARVSVGEKFQPALQLVVTTLTDLLKLIQSNPSIGIALTAAATGGLAALAARFVAGGPAGAAVGIAAGTGTFLYGLGKSADEIGGGIGGAFATLGGWESSTTRQATGDLAGLAARSRAGLLQSSTSALLKDAERSNKSAFGASFDEWILGVGSGEDRVKRQLEASNKRLSNAYEAKDRDAYVKELAVNESLKQQEKAFQARNAIARLEKRAESDRFKFLMPQTPEGEYRSSLYSIEEEQRAFGKEHGTWAETQFAKLRKAAEEKMLRERNKLNDETNRELEKMDVSITKSLNEEELKRVGLGRKENLGAALFTPLSERRPGVLIMGPNGVPLQVPILPTEAIQGLNTISAPILAPPEGYVDPKKAAEMLRDAEHFGTRTLQLGTRPGGEFDTIQQQHELQLRFAEKESKEVLRTAAVKATAEERERARIEALDELERKRRQADYHQIESLMQLEKQREDRLTGQIEGLFTDGLKGLQRFATELFLNPLKEGAARVIAEQLTPVLYGKNGNGGIIGSIYGIFGPAHRDPLSLVTASNTVATDANTAAVDRLTSALDSRLSGSPSTSTRVAGGYLQRAAGVAGLAGLLTLGTATASTTRVGGEEIGGGDSTTGLTRNAAGLWQRGQETGTAEDVSWLENNRYRLIQDYGPGSRGGTLPLGFAGVLGAGSILAGITPLIHMAFAGGPRNIESLGGGDSTAGLTRNAAGLWERAGNETGSGEAGIEGNGLPGGSPGDFGGEVSGIAGSAVGMLGKLKGAAPGLATLLGSQLFLNGLKRHSSGQTIAGGAITGAGIGLLGGPIGAIGGLGIGLAAAGLERGGVSGLGMDVAGGAALGFNLGGPLGAAIGAGAGALAGFVRLFVSGKAQQLHDAIKTTYQVDIPANSGVLKQILDTVNQSFGGSISTGIRAPQIMQLIELYAQSTGQPFGLSNTPRAAYLTETGGGLFQSAGYANGQSYGFASNVLGNYNGQTFDRTISGSNVTTAPQHVTVSLDGPSSAQFLQGQTVTAVNNNPGVVANANAVNYQNSNGRRESAGVLNAPTAILG